MRFVILWLLIWFFAQEKCVVSNNDYNAIGSPCSCCEEKERGAGDFSVGVGNTARMCQTLNIVP